MLVMGNCAGVQGNAEINPSFSAPNSSGARPLFLGFCSVAPNQCVAVLVPALPFLLVDFCGGLVWFCSWESGFLYKESKFQFGINFVSLCFFFFALFIVKEQF